jgi:hypothetical protein
MFLQYFATDVQLAAMVFWTFGDTARATWGELGLMAVVVLPGFFYFWAKSWSYNAMDAGDETARGLGVRVERVRMTGMLLSSLVTAVLIAFLGIIGFVGAGRAAHVPAHHRCGPPFSPARLPGRRGPVAPGLGHRGPADPGPAPFARLRADGLPRRADLSVPHHQGEAGMMLSVCGVAFSYNGHPVLRDVDFVWNGASFWPFSAPTGWARPRS